MSKVFTNDLFCSIKSSLRKRLNVSKTFVLIVGKQTKLLTKGGCQFCKSYSSYHTRCYRNHIVDYRSYIEYECQMAIKDYNDNFLSKGCSIDPVDLLKECGINLDDQSFCEEAFQNFANTSCRFA